jgi:hypothetical protein
MRSGSLRFHPLAAGVRPIVILVNFATALMKQRIAIITLTVAASLGAGPPTTQPSTDSGDMKFMSADQVFDQMTKPTSRPTRSLAPVSEADVHDRTGGTAAVRPNAPQVRVVREGTLVVDRLGRLSHTDSGAVEFTFESDGKALRDPPMLLLPNQKLGELEAVITTNNRDLKFRVTGVVTEYKGRNYLMVEKYIVPIDMAQQF